MRTGSKYCLSLLLANADSQMLFLFNVATSLLSWGGFAFVDLKL